MVGKFCALNEPSQVPIQIKMACLRYEVKLLSYEITVAVVGVYLKYKQYIFILRERGAVVTGLQ